MGKAILFKWKDIGWLKDKVMETDLPSLRRSLFLLYFMASIFVSEITKYLFNLRFLKSVCIFVITNPQFYLIVFLNIVKIES